MQRRAPTRHALRRSISSLRILLLALVVLASLASYGCAGVCAPPKTHIVMAEKNGGLVDPVKRTEVDPADYGAYVYAIFQDLAQFCQKTPSKPCKVLFYFHGGLNTPNAASNRAATLTQPILDSGSYPIFVNWDSSLLSSWWDHVAHVHKGYYRGRLRPILAPYYVAVDEVKSISDTLSDWAAEGRHILALHQGADEQGLRAFKELVDRHQVKPKRSVDVHDALLAATTPNEATPRLQDRRSFGDKGWPWLSLIPTLPTKLLAPPLVIQAAGTGAWSVMQRRTEMLFRTEAEFQGVSAKAVGEVRATGSVNTKDTTDANATQQEAEAKLARDLDTGAALAYFTNRFQDDFLRDFCENGTYTGKYKGQSFTEAKTNGAVIAASCKHPVEVTLVGHSMGSLIIDRLLRYRRDLQVKNIVFMAGATTVGDYRDTIHPYLEDHAGRPGHSEEGTQMYHLVLHPLAEYGERGFLDLTPRGSLLVWIDNYFTDPVSQLDRRVGRFSNLVPELAYSDGVSAQIHLKVFQVGSKLKLWNPQKHGDFGDFPFWDSNFWNPETPTEQDKGITPIERYKPCPCKKAGAQH